MRSELDVEQIKKIAKEQGLTQKQVHDIVTSQFEFVVDTIKQPNADGVRLKYLGLFHVKPKSVKFLMEKLNKEK